jgi:hypothetical protein
MGIFISGLQEVLRARYFRTSCSDTGIPIAPDHEATAIQLQCM